MLMFPRAQQRCASQWMQRCKRRVVAGAPSPCFTLSKRRAGAALGGTYARTTTHAYRWHHSFVFTSPQGIDSWFRQCTVRQANLFAQSRVTNYLKRAMPADASNAVAQLFSTERVHTSPPIYKTVLRLPVDVLVENQVTRRDVEACGFGVDARASRAACCMHAERYLDCLGVPLFASPQRQEEHAKEAMRDGGRQAPRHGELPHELSAVSMPPPFVAASPLYAIFSAASETVAPRSTTPCNDATMSAAAQAHLFRPSTRSASPSATVRRPIRFDHHYGPDPFLHRIQSELEGLTNSILTLQTAAMAACEGDDAHSDGVAGDDEDGDGGAAPVVIEADEIDVLQPEDTPAKAEPQPTHGRRPRAPRVAVAFTSSRTVPEHRCPERLPVDESEGGVFNLVEGDGTDWCTCPDVPSVACVLDPHAVERIQAYYAAVSPSDAGFESNVKVTTADEATNSRTRRGVWRAVPRPWWTVSVPVPRYENVQCQGAPLRAIGKATSVETATVLCAMHLELLLGFLGEPVVPHDALAQARYYDACLCCGRHVAPVPWMASSPSRAACDGQGPPTPNASVDTVESYDGLPRPLKEWFRVGRERLRHAPLTVTEKLLALNRFVVWDCRQHLVEVGLFDDRRCEEDGYVELLELAEPCVRSFLRSQRHPYESAYFILTLAKDSEYRATLYLPLPARYGVRGGYAVGSSPARAKALCALHAVDTLCSLGIVPLLYDPKEDTAWQRLLVLRAKLALTLPPTPAVAATLNLQLRSPPAYRESRDHGTRRVPPPDEVWRTMLLDASWFDIVPDGKDLQLTVPQDTKLPCADVLTAARHLFESYVQLTAGWGYQDILRARCHYCGPQHTRGHRRRAANTYWMRLPLDAQCYGERVAIGRCITRKGAERNFYLHAFRILATLDLIPWMTQSMATLQQDLYGGDAVRASLDVNLWNALAPIVLDPTHGQHDTNGAVADAVITATDEKVQVDRRSVGSPHPVMSYELARGTL